MTQRPRNRLVVFAVSAVAVAIAASVIVADAARDGGGRRSPRRVKSEHVARVVGAPTARPTRPWPDLHISSSRATTTATRFAASWRAWDIGRRSTHDAATLRRLSVAGLWQRLRHQRARPTAARSPTSLALDTLQAVATGHGSWRAALVARHPQNVYLGSLVIVATPTGPRVAEIQR